jgi:hypothetical protein
MSSSVRNVQINYAISQFKLCDRSPALLASSLYELEGPSEKVVSVAPTLIKNQIIKKPKNPYIDPPLTEKEKKEEIELKCTAYEYLVMQSLFPKNDWTEVFFPVNLTNGDRSIEYLVMSLHPNSCVDIINNEQHDTAYVAENVVTRPLYEIPRMDGTTNPIEMVQAYYIQGISPHPTRKIAVSAAHYFRLNDDRVVVNNGNKMVQYDKYVNTIANGYAFETRFPYISPEHFSYIRTGAYGICTMNQFKYKPLQLQIRSNCNTNAIYTTPITNQYTTSPHTLTVLCFDQNGVYVGQNRISVYTNKNHLLMKHRMQAQSKMRI